jgi:hypothetical protein
MSKRPKERLTRLGLPEKSESVVFAVTPTQKREIRAEAQDNGVTVTDYLLGLHYSFKQLTPEERERLIHWRAFAPKKGGRS